MHHDTMTYPRGSIWAANIMFALIGLIRRLDAYLVERRSHRPGEPRTAQEVLDYAKSIEKSEPGFAADLRAAVLRSQE